MTWKEQLEKVVPTWSQIASKFAMVSIWPVTELVWRFGVNGPGPIFMTMSFLYLGFATADLKFRLQLRRVLRSLGSQEVSA